MLGRAHRWGANPARPPPHPSYRVGDRWIYSGMDGYRLNPIVWEETHEVIGVDAQGIAIRVTQKGPTVDTSRIERLSAPGLVIQGAMFDSETRRFKTPLVRYQFPLTPGARWNQFIDNLDESTGNEGTVNNYRSVGGWEKVAVPAGTFDAIIVRDFSHLDDETPFRYATALNYQIWWSPAVGASVRETRSQRTGKRTRASLPSSTKARTAMLELTSYRRAG